ncbi:MAG TPA: hypothetical protein PKA33_15910 [Amaricoccus sp.]|uniref:hypothetical protein n=1 Tax=Amaricoccus sp. TaxID=1872485 RepID=UPI002C67367F|nr:hypothetical protein [Amaricoccus sp.]HMQ92511.1 hypothetical protein [Amaricoccus sp.]HMR53840.1 hypothetical protein [Amaricoccus sp.]HMR58957.1 hypothetical protein [Amaricoccus sp.]HMU00835.1 hypothetical protein [Amaricoccus sp.]
MPWLSIFSWRLVHLSGPWAYCENWLTGAREAVWLGGTRADVDHDWLAGAATFAAGPDIPTERQE